MKRGLPDAVTTSHVHVRFNNVFMQPPRRTIRHILRRMESHQSKKSARLRPLRLSAMMST